MSIGDEVDPGVVDQLLDVFEKQWSADEENDLREFVPESGGAVATETLWELALTDLELRLKAGQKVRVESYLERYPELGSDTVRVGEFIESEFATRSRREPGLRIDEYRERFPDHELKFLNRLNGTVIEQPADIARYYLKQPQGEGGLGKVWVAYDEHLDRYVALKEIKPKLAGDLPSRQRFEHEAVVTSRLQHPGIVPVYSRGRHVDGRAFYTMQLVQGKSLDEAIEEFHSQERNLQGTGNRSVASRRLLSQLIDVCKTVDYAHRRGVIHRDIKPRNVMLADEGGTFLIDWGLAKTKNDSPCTGDDWSLPSGIHQTGTVSTKIGRALGSPAYMSPEQARGDHGDVDERTDIYSLGATLFAMLTNRPPFVGNDTDSIVALVASGNTPRADEVGVSVPKRLNSICCKAMASEKEDRYSSAGELASDLELYLADQPIAAHRESFFEKLTRWSRRYQSAIRAATLAAVILGLLGAGWAVHANRLAGRASAAAAKADVAREQAVVARERADVFATALATILQLPDEDTPGTKVEINLAAASEQAQRIKDPETKALWVLAIANTMTNLGRYDKSLESAEEGLALPNIDKPTRLKLMHAKAIALRSIERVEEAVPIFREIYAQKKVLHGKLHSESIDALNEVGLALYSLNRHAGLPHLEEAIEVLEETLSLRKQVEGDYLALIATESQLGRAYLRRPGRRKEGVELTQSAFRGILSRLHGDRANDAVLKAALSEMAYDVTALPEVEPELLQAVSEGLLALARSHQAAGEHEEAVQYYQRLYDVRLEKLGAEHNATLTALSLLGQAHARGGDLVKGIEIMEEYLTKGSHDLAAKNNLSEFCAQTGDFARALELQQEIAVAAEELNWPTANLDMWNQAYAGLSRAYINVGDYDTGLPIMKSVYKWCKGNGNPGFLRFVPVAYAGYLMQDRRFKEADLILRESADAARLANEKYQDMGLTRTWLEAEVLYGLDKKDEALTKFKSALSLFQSRQGSTFKLMSNHVRLMIELCEESDQFDGAIVERARILRLSLKEESVDRQRLFYIEEDFQRIIDHYTARDDKKQVARWKKARARVSTEIAELVIR